MTTRIRVAVGAAAVLLVGVGVLTAGQAHGQTRTPVSNRAPMVLFMCPHGAAKSVLASAYFQREAKARGLKVIVESAGTDPDAGTSRVPPVRACSTSGTARTRRASVGSR